MDAMAIVKVVQDRKGASPEVHRVKRTWNVEGHELAKCIVFEPNGFWSNYIPQSNLYHVQKDMDFPNASLI
jgi:hypothetical protein